MRLLRSLFVTGTLLAASLLQAAPVTVNPWNTAGNGSPVWPTGSYEVSGLALTGTSRTDWGNTTVTGYLYVQAYGFSDLHGVSYPNAGVGEVSILPYGGNTDGVTLYDFDLGSWAGASRNVTTTIYNGDYSQILAQGSTPVGAAKGTYIANVFSPNGVRIQFNSPIGDQNAIDNIRLEVGNPLGLTVVPGPAAGWLLATGLLGLGGVARRRQRRG
ncbi:MAG: VPLPA-CTERM sorting domain-containing protein [Gammaproteobacteria bacterium]|nr:VPLPA-CTERM sorting domain-containing protein [Gammaproteobacteria bacterium]